MDHLLDRYVDITSTPWIASSCKYQKHAWCAESYLMKLMLDRYHVCMIQHLGIGIVHIRQSVYTLRFRNFKHNDNHWIHRDGGIEQH